MTQQSINLTLLYPELILSVTLGVVLVVDLFVSEKRRSIAFWLSMIGVIAAFVAVLKQAGFHLSTFDGGYVIDDFTTLAKGFFLVVAACILLLSARYVKEGKLAQGEYYFLMLTAFLGCVLMPSVRDLIMLFIAIELVSIPGFLMAAFRKKDPRSNEAGLKFFLIGVLSSAIMLYGMSLIYGVTGSLNLPEISATLGKGTLSPIAGAAIVLVVVGLGFKVSAVPFHFWAPDTYEGAPVPVTAFLSVASKAAGFTGLLILMFIGFGSVATFWRPLFAVLAVLTMFLGNLVALRQTQVVRLAAYSSIAQAGYILIPFAVAGYGLKTDSMAFTSTFLYVMIYGIMNLGLFAVIIAVHRERPSLLLKDFAGLIRRSAWLGFALVVFLVSLAGLPPTAGFWGKFSIGTVSIAAGGAGPILAVFMFVNSVISVGYYFKLVQQATLREPTRRGRIPAPFGVSVVAMASLAIVLIVGVFPNILTDITSSIIPGL